MKNVGPVDLFLFYMVLDKNLRRYVIIYWYVYNLNEDLLCLHQRGIDKSLHDR